MPVDLDIVAEPLDETRCRFVVSPPVPGPPQHFDASADASGSAVAQAVLSVAGVCELSIDGGEIMIRKDAAAPSWVVLEPRVRYALGMALAHTAGSAPAPSAAPVDDDAIYERVSLLLEREINPAVARHGGQVELVDVQEGNVLVRLSGGCQGCGMASVTLRQGIEASLRRAIPSLRGLTDLTDHASGTRPYFSAATK